MSQQIDQYLQDVAGNTIEQTTASRQVNQTMEMVENIALNTSTEAKAVVQLLQDLVTEVQTLKTSVAKFRLE